MKTLHVPCGAALLCASALTPAHAASLSLMDMTLTSKYVVVVTEDGVNDARDFAPGSGSNTAGTVERSAFGRVHREQSDSNSNVVPSANDYPDPTTPAQELPEVDEPSVATFGGNIAILDDDVGVNFSTMDLYAGQGGGVDCLTNCFDASSNSNFFTPDTPDGTDAYGRAFEIGDGGTDVSALDRGIGIDEGAIQQNNGVNEGVDLTGVSAEVDATFAALNALRDDSSMWTHVWTPGSGGDISNYYPGDRGDFVLSDQLGGSLRGVNGNADAFFAENIIYVDTGGNDFKFTNTNFILDGTFGQDFIFLLEEGANFLIGNSELLVGPEMDLFSTLWFVGDESKRTIDFSQSESLGMAFWNDSPNGVIQANNYRACGQYVSQEVGDWNDFSVDRCAPGAALLDAPRGDVGLNFSTA